jgi:hypothetical protein
VALSANVGGAGFLIGFDGVNVLDLGFEVNWSGILSFDFFV